MLSAVLIKFNDKSALIYHTDYFLPLSVFSSLSKSDDNEGDHDCELVEEDHHGHPDHGGCDQDPDDLLTQCCQLYHNKNWSLQEV